MSIFLYASCILCESLRHVNFGDPSTGSASANVTLLGLLCDVVKFCVSGPVGVLAVWVFCWEDVLHVEGVIIGLLPMLTSSSTPNFSPSTRPPNCHSINSLTNCGRSPEHSGLLQHFFLSLGYLHFDPLIPIPPQNLHNSRDFCFCYDRDEDFDFCGF